MQRKPNRGECREGRATESADLTLPGLISSCFFALGGSWGQDGAHFPRVFSSFFALSVSWGQDSLIFLVFSRVFLLWALLGAVRPSVCPCP